MATRYMRKGTSTIIFAPTVASATLAPTAAEALAGTVLNAQLTELNGFTFANSPIAAPDFDSLFVSQTEGEDTAENSSMTFHELDAFASNVVKAALTKGTVGFMLLAPYDAAPLAAADTIESWPVKIVSAPRLWTAGNETAKYRVDMVITSPPAIDVAVLA